MSLNEIKKKKKEKMYDAATELCNKQFEKFYDERVKLPDTKKNKLDHKFKHVNLKFEDDDYDRWFTEEKS